VRKLGYALYMAAMGFAGGYIVNVGIGAQAEVFSADVGMLLAYGAALIGFIGALLVYDEAF
jgi:hypothetical protein